MTRACIVSASGQNVFFEEMLDALHGALVAHGVEISRAVDHFPPPEDGLAYLFVPHEFMPLTQAEAHPSAAHMHRTVALCTEQPGTTWFDEAAEIAADAHVAIDINRQGVAELRWRGIRTELLQLGYVPDWDHWGGDESRLRDLDVTFMGGHTERRGRALAACAPVLAGRPVALHLYETAAPHTADSPSFFSGARKWDHLARCRTMVNVHRSPLAYFEWQRMIGAIANGCVVLTEHSLGGEPLVAGEHFISTSCESMAPVLRAFLDDEERIARVRREAYAFLREQLPLSACICVLADALESAARQRVAGSASSWSAPWPLPAPAPERVPEYERTPHGELHPLRMALKHLVLRQQDLSRRLDRLEPHAARGDSEESHGPERPNPRVSVILTVYNYARFVGDAIHSVARSDFEDYELVVIEDGSSDDSLEAVREALAASPWMPARVVARGSNCGLPRARNLGLELARGEFAFILDADNEVYPHCLGRLVETLDSEADLSFAYGILQAFSAQGPQGLVSWLAWDSMRLRYGNFVDAMAMIRRESALERGGYVTDPRLHGWEDFALWCAFADSGKRGRLVPEIVGRYRRTPGSMLSLTDLDGTSAWAALVERYPVLTQHPAAVA